MGFKLMHVSNDYFDEFKRIGVSFCIILFDWVSVVRPILAHINKQITKGKNIMKLFKDMISGDELTSDSYRCYYPEEYMGACMKQKAKYRQKKGDQIIIASDEEPEDDPEVETVVDIVDAAEL